MSKFVVGDSVYVPFKIIGEKVDGIIVIESDFIIQPCGERQLLIDSYGVELRNKIKPPATPYIEATPFGDNVSEIIIKYK